MDDIIEIIILKEQLKRKAFNDVKTSMQSFIEEGPVTNEHALYEINNLLEILGIDCEHSLDK